ncbi:MAG TPA: hypothetical protein VNL18_11780 [Gemmatimonadales bacterium]|nr:hypothetical protein [Gemmatimonadales bacterium]
MIASAAPPRPVMNAKKWARVKRSGTHGLRRGAWYPVVADPNSGMLVLNVRRDNVPVLRAHVDLSEAPPTHWSVVQWDEKQPGATRATKENLGLVYGVCPGCAGRAQLPPQTQRLTCPECGREFPVDWDHPC